PPQGWVVWERRTGPPRRARGHPRGRFFPPADANGAGLPLIDCQPTRPAERLHFPPRRLRLVGGVGENPQVIDDAKKLYSCLSINVQIKDKQNTVREDVREEMLQKKPATDLPDILPPASAHGQELA